MFNLKKIVTLRTFDTPFIIVLRHAQKFVDTEPSRYDCDITEEGIEQSNNLGTFLNKMPFVINTIKTSPVPRCIQTAKIIHKKLSYSNNLEESFLLGHPGVYINDEKLAGKIFEEYSVFDIVYQYISGHPFVGFRDLADGNRLLLQAMLSDLQLQKNSLYVSHDVILASFIGSLLQLPMHQNCWIDYLQGFVVTLSGSNALSLHIEDKEFKVYI